MKSNVYLVVFLLFLSSCAPAAETTPAPESAVETSMYVEMVDSFYTLNNEAQNKNDFYQPWDMLTNKTQCGSRYKCEFSIFQDWWWKWKVAYKLYDCGSDFVVAEELRYPRTESAAAEEESKPQYWRYELGMFEEKLMISEIKLSQPPDSACTLVIDRSK